MFSWISRLHRLRNLSGRRRPICLAVESLERRELMSAAPYVQTNLVSDISGMAQVTDPHLVNPWGLTSSPTSPFWISDEVPGVSTLYNGAGQIVPLVVNIPNGKPTGTVFNADPSASDFVVTEGTKSGAAVFIFDSLAGTISAWSPGVDLTHAVPQITVPGAVYTGLTMGVNSLGQTQLYAADNSKGTVDVFNTKFQMVGSFTDPNLPVGFAPFNVQNINNQLYVEFNKGRQGAPGQGFVDIFSTDGQLVKELIKGGALNNPWGVALAPANFGDFSNDLLVGNFGDGHINAFNPANGHFVGQLDVAPGVPFEEDHLWALRFGSGNLVGTGTNTLFFTAGIQNETHGLFGSLQATPESIVPNLPLATEQITSTIPTTGTGTGDNNPYGVAFVPQGFASGGVLQPGDLLVSNFNSTSGTQGTGTTIVRVTPAGQQSVFFQGQAPLGLTTALGALKSGFVLVGNVPNVNGTVENGSILIIDKNGNQVGQIADSKLLQGPWDLTINDQGDHAQVFVSDVLSGTVTRIDLKIEHGKVSVEHMTQIASGYVHRPDTNALVIGPTGLAYDAKTDTLYVASTGDNAIFKIPNAAHEHDDDGKGTLVYQDLVHLHGPLGLVLAPNGDLITANGDAAFSDPKQINELVEFTPTGLFVGEMPIDNSKTAGGAFGIAVESAGGKIQFAAVNDNTNSVQVWTLAPASNFTKHHGDSDDSAALEAMLQALANQVTQEADSARQRLL